MGFKILKGETSRLWGLWASPGPRLARRDLGLTAQHCTGSPPPNGKAATCCEDPVKDLHSRGTCATACAVDFGVWCLALPGGRSCGGSLPVGATCLFFKNLVLFIRLPGELDCNVLGHKGPSFQLRVLRRAEFLWPGCKTLGRTRPSH